MLKIRLLDETIKTIDKYENYLLFKEFRGFKQCYHLITYILIKIGDLKKVVFSMSHSVKYIEGLLHMNYPAADLKGYCVTQPPNLITYNAVVINSLLPRPDSECISE